MKIQHKLTAESIEIWWVNYKPFQSTSHEETKSFLLQHQEQFLQLLL